MKRAMLAGFAAIATALMLGGCGEKSQDPGPAHRAGGTVTSDTEPWQKGPALEFQVGDFTRGDQKSWDDAMTQRAQTQNEYVRIGGGSK